MRPKRTSLLGLSVAAWACLAGCMLVSGQFVVIHEFGDVTASTSDSITMREIDLTENSDFEEHQDDLASIEDVAFETTVHNNLTATAHARIYVSERGDLTTFEQIEDHAILVLESPELGSLAEIFIPFEDSRDYLHNLEAFKTLAMTGHFYVYATAAAVPFNISMDALTVALTLNFEIG